MINHKIGYFLSNTFKHGIHGLETVGGNEELDAACAAYLNQKMKNTAERIRVKGRLHLIKQKNAIFCQSCRGSEGERTTHTIAFHAQRHMADAVVMKLYNDSATLRRPDFDVVHILGQHLHELNDVIFETFFEHLVYCRQKLAACAVRHRRDKLVRKQNRLCDFHMNRSTTNLVGDFLHR